MAYYLGHWLVSAAALLLTGRLVKGFHLAGWFAALVASVVIGMANYFVWPVLIFLTLPINILTLGLFTFFVNGAVLRICAALLPGFEIDSWLSAVFGSIVLSCLNYFLHYALI